MNAASPNTEPEGPATPHRKRVIELTVAALAVGLVVGCASAEQSFWDTPWPRLLTVGLAAAFPWFTVTAKPGARPFAVACSLGVPLLSLLGWLPYASLHFPSLPLIVPPAVALAAFMAFRWGQLRWANLLVLALGLTVVTFVMAASPWGRSLPAALRT